jgi:hypothetical protein
MGVLWLLAVSAVAVTASPALPEGKESCVACNPAGVKSITSPIIGKDDLARFYEDLLNTVSGINFSRRHLFVKHEKLQQRADTGPICCKQDTEYLKD